MTVEIDWDALAEKTILVVDDSDPMRDIIYCLVRECGCKNILKTDSGTTALEILDSNKIDMIFLDIEMHEISGLEVLAYAKNQSSDIFVVMLSGHSSPDIIKNAMSNGANGFMVKPCSLQKIKEALGNFAKAKGLIKQ